ncbi:Mitochondrial dicarboxylate transporter [Rhodotorula mucilaginosa]|uniref:Mitochondrial dicarboxylate transporter n=1 Tax=Rhodotorula mucilaginosa TaxID=5537 RepID=A0A9P6VSI2_RHOMI|nr:Mitochondrial dicarboxylate transporter [Rhodotorula mucilaginosa]
MVAQFTLLARCRRFGNTSSEFRVSLTTLVQHTIALMILAQRFTRREGGAVTDPAHARPPRSGSYFTPLSQGGFGVNTAPAPSRVVTRPAVTARAPSSTEPTLSCTLWEDERCIVVQVVVGGHVVARRTDNDWVNSTKLLNMVDGLSRGKRDMFLKNEPDRLVFRRGALHLKGVWLPLEAAARLAREHGLLERLYPLFEPAIVPYLLLPAHRPQTSQLVATARARRALLEAAGDDQAAGSPGAEIQRDMQRRQVALDAVLQRLEEGLRGLPPPQADCHRPTTATTRLQSEAADRRRASSGPMFGHSAGQGATNDMVGGRQRPRSASVAIARRDAIRGSTSTTVSSLGTTRIKRDSDDASSTSSRSSSSSSFSSLEFTPLESDMRKEQVLADSAGARSTRWSPVTSSYTLVLAPDAASTSSASTLHSVPGSRSRTASGVALDADHGPASEADHGVLAVSAEALDDDRLLLLRDSATQDGSFFNELGAVDLVDHTGCCDAWDKATAAAFKTKVVPLLARRRSSELGSSMHPRMQTQKGKGFIRTIVDSVKADGLRRGAYAGLSASILRQMTYSVTRFGVYDELKKRLQARHPVGAPLPVWEMAAAASVAGGLGGLAGNPADVVLVRMTADAGKPVEQRLGYKHCFDGVFRIIREEGASALFRGVGPNCARAVLMNASQLATYDTFKEMILSTGLIGDGIGLYFASSFMAGTVATTVCAPFDVIKTRIMNASGQASISSVIAHSFKHEGMGWMFKGWTPAFIRLSPNTIIVFLTLEELKKLVDKLRA